MADGPDCFEMHSIMIAKILSTHKVILIHNCKVTHIAQVGDYYSKIQHMG